MKLPSYFRTLPNPNVVALNAANLKPLRLVKADGAFP